MAANAENHCLQILSDDNMGSCRRKMHEMQNRDCTDQSPASVGFTKERDNEVNRSYNLIRYFSLDLIPVNTASGDEQGK
jgi:hypothetical protein